MQSFTYFANSLLHTLSKYEMKPSTCPLDILPIQFLKEVFDTVTPSVLQTCKLLSVKVPFLNFLSALVQPLLKKPSLNSSDPNNFRPISSRSNAS